MSQGIGDGSRRNWGVQFGRWRWFLCCYVIAVVVCGFAGRRGRGKVATCGPHLAFPERIQSLVYAPERRKPSINPKHFCILTCDASNNLRGFHCLKVLFLSVSAGWMAIRIKWAQDPTSETLCNCDGRHTGRPAASFQGETRCRPHVLK
jgi:hypothetical protein